MNISFKKNPSLWFLVPWVLGALIFILVTGGGIVWPQNVNWLLNGDPAQHWLGWQFFRNSPLLQWPLGANPDFGTEIGSSIVFTDSIPLLAFIFKPFSSLLPVVFQYIGMWVLLCFMLQCHFSYKLLSLFTSDKWLPIIGCVFFAIAPVALFRLTGHYALFGHWLIVAALYLYCSKIFTPYKWIILLAVTALIHAYLLAMVLTLWLVDLAQRFWKKNHDAKYLLMHAVMVVGVLAAVMYAAGYFMLKGGVQTLGFGAYRMNLLAFFDTENFWSALIPDIPNRPGDYEGSSYLGSGIIVLALIALTVFFKKNHPSESDTRTKALPLFLLGCSLFIYALSNHIAISDIEAFQYPLPSITTTLIETFRASGRFIWPTYYIIYLAVFYVIFTRLNKKIGIVLCSALLAFQLADMHKVWNGLKNLDNGLTNTPGFNTLTTSPAWTDLANHYKHIVYVLPSNQPKDWFPLSELAAMHRMSINMGYFARTNPDAEKKARDRLIKSISDNEFNQDSLYVFENTYLWSLANKRLHPMDRAGVLDGMRVLAPGLAECSNCLPATYASIVPEVEPQYNYTSGALLFASGKTGEAHLAYGWGGVENWGTWSDGKVSSIRVNLMRPKAGDVKLMLKAHAFVSKEHPLQKVDLWVSGKYLSTLEYRFATQDDIKTVTIPDALIRENNGQLSIVLKYENAISPKQLGLSEDKRELALGLISLDFTAD